MRKLGRVFLVLLAFAVAGGLLIFLPSHAQETPKPLRLIVEAEDFKPVEGDWAVKEFGSNYFAATFAVSFLSRGRYLGAPEQGAASKAVREIDVPRDGAFEVWARYEQPYDYSVEFDIEIEQGGKAVFQRGYGRRDAPKLWAFGKGFQPQVLWEWGGGDNIVWEGRDAKVSLKKGKATLVLKKGPQKSEQAARRNVDLVMLTDDQAGIQKQLKEAKYLPLDGWLTQEGDVFLQVQNPEKAESPIAVKVGPCTEHSPYWIHVRDWPKELWVSKQASDKPPKPEDYLKPGEKSAAIEVGRFFDTLNQFQWRVNVVGPDGKPAAGRKLRLSFSPHASGKEPLRDEAFTTGPDGNVDFFLDSDIRRTKRIRTVDEDLAELAKLVKSFPKKGRKPEQMLFYGIMDGVTEKPGRVGELSREIALGLGANTLPQVQNPKQNALIDVRGVATKDLAAHCQKLKQDGKADRLKVVSLGDEIHIGDGAKSPDDDPAFRDFLNAKKLRAEDLGLKSLDDAKLELKDKKSLLYYHSQMFSLERAIAHYKERTDLLEANLPKGIVTGANYSPHPYYWPKEGQWIRAFKRRAMTLPWGEDYAWQIPEANQQVIGYMLAALRCGAKYHELPIHWYVMPHYPGQTPDNFRRAFYSAIGHGAKQLNFFAAVPLSVAYTENYVVSEAKETWKAIHEVVHEAGLFEGLVMQSKPRSAQVAMLISFAQDLWDADPAYNHERKCLYLALRQMQFPVDFVTEEDIQEEKHKDYRTIYIVGNHLERKTAEALKSWVKEGGALAGIAGGGFLDEHNRPMDVLNEVYGVTKQKVERKDAVIMSKQQLPRLQPLDQVTWTEGKKFQFPALAFKQTMTPAESAMVLAQYANGSPAAVRNAFGKGHAQLFGSFISSAFVREAIPLRPWDRGTTPEAFAHFLPQDFGELIDVVTSPCGLGEVRYEVITDHTEVETCILDAPNGLAVVLINWSSEPKDLRLTLQYVPPAFNFATSVSKGPLNMRRLNESIVLRLKVDVADVVLIEK